MKEVCREWYGISGVKRVFRWKIGSETVAGRSDRQRCLAGKFSVKLDGFFESPGDGADCIFHKNSKLW